MKRALVLSGGGAKGSYQIGVWKALRKLNIKFDIVTGCSIGSINAALFVENKYFIAKRMWKKLTTDDLFSKDDSKFIKGVGMKFDRAEHYLKKLINEEKVRKSKIDYGLLTVNLKNHTPKFLTKSEIPNGKLIDYILASSTFYPFVEKKDIDGEFFVDGGFYDNMPINLAIDMGATEVLAIDLNSVGMKKNTKDKTVTVNIIKDKQGDIGALNFTKELAKIRIKQGYNDTMKFYNKFEGNIYTFKKGSLEKNYKKISNYYIKLLKSVLFNNKLNVIQELFKIAKYNTLFTDIKQNRDISSYLLESLEYLGTLFSLDETKVYNINNYNRILITKAKELNYLKVDKKLKGKMLIGYIYNKYMEAEDKSKVCKELFNLALIFQKDFLAAIYLISISKEYPITLQADKFYQEVYNLLSKQKS